MEMFWAFPSRHGLDYLTRKLVAGNYAEFSQTVARIVRALLTGSYRRNFTYFSHNHDHDVDFEADAEVGDTVSERGRPYFEILVVDAITPEHEELQRNALRETRRHEDQFIYEPVVVPSFEDALIAILFNHNIQSVVVRYDFHLQSAISSDLLQRYLKPVACGPVHPVAGRLWTGTLPAIAQDAPGAGCVPGHRPLRRRHRRPRSRWLPTGVLQPGRLHGAAPEYPAGCSRPLRNAVLQRTQGILHASPPAFSMPCQSVAGSPSPVQTGFRDMGEFYGMNIFMAETSATSGGLDSLLEPHGPIKRAQELASRAFGSKLTVFATNGTSTCNKIVVQAVIRPGDIVLVDRDCHKSHHYGMVLSGAKVVYLDSYPAQ